MAELLAAVLDRLIPGDGPWPAAGALGLAGRTAALMAEPPGGEAWLAALPGRLPGFAALDGAGRDAALARLEAEAPELFGSLLRAAFTAYYTDPRVGAVIARETGYPARPPQPEGHALPPFDAALLRTQLGRAPFWRRTGGPDGTGG